MYPLVEIFESLQGEGRNTGRPCVFIRFAGCNLACQWCDTDTAMRFELSLKELIAEVKTYRAKSVVLTGGEPTIQKGMEELVSALKSEGYYIAVETNGLLAPDWLERVDYIACSPKIEYREQYCEHTMLRHAGEVRIVSSQPEIEDFAVAIRRLITAEDYYISPCERDGNIDFATAKEVLSHLDGFSLSVQLHKIIGFR